MITIKMDKTYDGKKWDEAAKTVMTLKSMGWTDEEINKMLEKSEDKESQD